VENNDALALAATGLTKEEKTFVDALVADPDFNVSEAARSIGLTVKPGDAGLRMLKKAAVVKYLAALQADRRERHADIRDQVIQALWGLAAGWDVADLIGEIERIDPETGQIQQIRGLLAPDRLPPALRAAIKGVKRNKDGGWEYTFVDRSAILALLLKHFGEADKASNAAGDGPKEGETKVVFFE
jgi:hypothetical protein